MLREQRKDIFENMYNEATRYAKEIHKKGTSVENDSLRFGKNKQEDFGRYAKFSHPGYGKGAPDLREKKPGSILEKQMQKDFKKGKEPSEKQFEELGRSIKRRHEITHKNEAYYKNSNHGNCDYNKKEDI